MSRLEQVISAAVAVYEAQKRIPADLKPYSYFGAEDVWVYHFVSDDRLCDQCRLYAEIEFWAGDELRSTFPFLEITSKEIINVNVHPNCRCYLTRLFEIPPEYEVPLEI